MKKAVCILLTVALVFAMAAGCGKTDTEGTTAGNTESQNAITEAEVTLPAAQGTEAVAEGEAVMTTQLYLLSRAYCTELENFDMENFDADEYVQLVADASEALRITEAFCVSLEEHADILAEMEEDGIIQREKASYEQAAAADTGTNYSPFITTVYAAEEKSAAVKYAEELTKTFDSAKNGQKLKTVAEKYGTDVKKAKAMLDQAQAILEGAAYEDQAEFENTCYKVAVDTKAVATTAGFVVSCVATGGTVAGIIDAGGIVCGGLQSIVDVGTAVGIHASDGDGNVYTEYLDKADQVLSGVSAVFSIGSGVQNIIDFRNPAEAKKKVDNAAQAFLTGIGFVRDYVQEGKVLGISSEIYEGYSKVIFREADCSDTEAAKEVLTSTGITEETLNNTQEISQEEALQALADSYIETMGDIIDPSNPADVDTYLENIDEAFLECAAEDGYEAAGKESIQSETEKSETTKATEKTTEAATKDEETTEPDETESEATENEGVLPASEIAGTYVFESDGEPWTQIVTAVDDSHLQFLDADDPEAVIVGSYNENTGVFNYSEENEGITSSVRVTFSKDENSVRAEMVLSLSNESGSYDAFASAVKQ